MLLHRVTTLAVPLVLAAALCSGAGTSPRQAGVAVSGRQSQHSFGKHLSVDGIRNFGQVTPRLYRGGQPTVKGFQALARMGVDIVVDSRATLRKSEGQEVRKLGMRYYAIEWHCPFPKDEIMAKFLKIVHDHPGKKIFVHCRLGNDRTGMLIASYRMAEQGWSPDEAMKEMEDFGYNRLHHLMCMGMPRYVKRFPEHFKKNPVFAGLRPQDTAQKSK
jgi:tyrosine-protein phosphatase SIW14